MFIVKNVANVPMRVLWNAALCGGVICGPEYVIHGDGPCMTYHAALGTQRLLWMTDRFVRAHGSLSHGTLHRMVCERVHLHASKILFVSTCFSTKLMFVLKSYELQL